MADSELLFSPEWLETLAGVEKALAIVSAEKTKAKVDVERIGAEKYKRYGHEERLKDAQERYAQLADVRRGLLDRKDKLAQAGEASFEKTFRRVVRERFGAAVFQELVDTANAELEQRHIRTAPTAVGFAIPMRASVGGHRQRRKS
jgi:chromosome segregation ATPase